MNPLALPWPTEPGAPTDEQLGAAVRRVLKRRTDGGRDPKSKPTSFVVDLISELDAR